MRRLRCLPAETLVCCAHEYTLENMAFARLVEPENAALQARLPHDQARIDQGQPTLPTTLALECATNPFLRWDQTNVRTAAERYAGRTLETDLDVVTTLRAWRDAW